MTFRICFWVGKKAKYKIVHICATFLRKGNVNIFAFIFLNWRNDNKKLLVKEKGRGHKWDFTNIFCLVIIILELWKCFICSIYTHTYTWNHENIWSHSWTPVRLTGGWPIYQQNSSGSHPFGCCWNSMGGECPCEAPELGCPRPQTSSREHSRSWKRCPFLFQCLSDVL